MLDNELNPHPKKGKEPESASVSEGSKQMSTAGNEQAVIAFALAGSDFYKHGLERFLEGIGKLLRVPWWVVQIGLYLATAVAFVLLIDVPKLYPNGGYFSYGAELVGEFTFATFMLYHLRRCRTIAFLAAARISNEMARLIWLKKYLAPTYWGWTLLIKIPPRFKFQLVLRTWLATIIVLIVYYCGQFLYYRTHLPWLIHSHSFWDDSYPHPQLLYLYVTIAKAAIMVAGLAHFWWLYGVLSIFRGIYPSSMSQRQKQILQFECRQAVVRFNVGIGAAAGIWMLAHDLTYGATLWFYLYSVWLLMIFIGQLAIIQNLKPFSWFSFLSFRQLIWPIFDISHQIAGINQSALWAVRVSIVSPVILGHLGAFISKQ